MPPSAAWADEVAAQSRARDEAAAPDEAGRDEAQDEATEHEAVAPDADEPSAKASPPDAVGLVRHDPAAAAADQRGLPSTGRNGDGRHASRPGSWQDPYTRPARGNGHANVGNSVNDPSELSLAPWPGPGNGTAKEPRTQPYQMRQGDRRPGAARTSASDPDEIAAAGPPSAPGRPAGAAGRDQGSRPGQDPGQLHGDHSDLVAALLAACRAAEGQNIFGGYGSSGLTPVMQRIAAQLELGGLAPGSEENTLKPADRMFAKLTRLIARHPDRTPQELAAGIGDGVRYAFAFEPDYYTDGTWQLHRKLKAQGFELEARRNRWESPELKGVWTRWRDPAHGLAFEVQFHTNASWDVAQRTHPAYIRITDPRTPAGERARLRARQVAAAAAAKAPPGCAEISDFSRDPR